MNKILILLPLFCFHFQSFSQTDTIHIAKKIEGVYRCVDEDARQWYIYGYDGNQFILANLKIPEKETLDWFRRYQNSQNLYKGSFSFQGAKKVLVLRKHDQTDDTITFEIVDLKPDQIILKELVNKTVFVFEKIPE